MSLDRRDFLKTLAASTAGAAVAASATEAEARENKTMPPGAVGLLFDGTLCIGCRACMAACKEENGMPPERTPLEAGDVWDAPLDLSGKTLNIIKAYKDGSGAVKDRAADGFAFTKMSCYHCVDPSCMSVCPVSAMKKDPVTGVVRHDPAACIGCRYCMAACPFYIPRFQFDEPFPKITKCELCPGRLAAGKDPACAEACPTGATLFGPVKQLKAEAARRLALEAGAETRFERRHVGSGDAHVAKAARYVDHLYGDREIGGTQVLHLSAVPFDKLGKPTLAERSPAAVSETLQHGIYKGMVAPLAVLAALVGAAWKNMRAKDEPAPGGPAGREGGEA